MKGHAPKVQRPTPAWLKLAAKNALFRARDLAPLFGYTMSGFGTAVHNGRFPPHEAVGTFASANLPASHYHQWTKATVVAEYLRRRKEEDEKSVDK